MRSLAPGAVSALMGQHVCIACLVEMDLTEPLNLNTSDLDLMIDGTDYFGTGALGQIDAVQETSAEIPQISFSLAAADPTMIALALAEPVQGKAVRIKIAIFDPASGALLDVQLRYSGVLDTMAIVDGRDAATIKVTSESALLDLLRPKGIYYNDLDQQALHPGDTAFEFVNDQVEKKTPWPTSAFFQK